MPSAKTDIEGGRVGISGTIDISDRCSRLLGQLCSAGSPIDPRAIRALNFLTDKVDVSGSTVSLTGGVIDVSDRCARLLGQLCSGGIAIDPRQIRNLAFLTDKVDVSGSSVTTVTGSLTTMEDAFMAFRLMMNYLDDLSLTIDPSTSRLRVNVETGTLTSVGSITTVGFVTTVGGVTLVTGVGSVNNVVQLQNLVNLGGIPALTLITDNMYLLWATAIRPRIT